MRHACLSIAILLLALSANAHADCGAARGGVRILSNDFYSLRLIGDAAEGCAGPDLSVTRNQTTTFTDLQIPALKANPASYTVVMVSNNSMVSLLNNHLIRPLDELVAKYGRDLDSKQLVKIDGRVMAVAFMVNAQHLFYREDILARAGVPVPQTYEEVLEAARLIRAKGILPYPLAATDRPDWDLGEEFINLYLGYGGELFKAHSAEAAIDNASGVKTLEMMKALSRYMRPEYLTYSIDVLPPIWAAGEIAMANLWGSSAQMFLTGKSAVPAIAASTRFAAAPRIGGGTIPATSMWWDGFCIATNISDREADASFQVMIHAIAPAVADAHPNAAVWITRGYRPGPTAVGVLASMRALARSYPTVPYMGYLHNAIGANLAKFMLGQQSATQALASAVDAYSTAAREAGYLH